MYLIVLVLEKASFRESQTIEHDILNHFGFSEKNDIVSKVETAGELVVFDAWRPLATSGDIEKGNNILVSNREIGKYFLAKDVLGSLKKFRSRDIQPGKIILKKICFNLEAGFDDFGSYPINTTYCVKGENESDMRYILGLLNSKLMTYYAREKYAKTALRGGFIELRVFQIKQLPLFKVSGTAKDEIVNAVSKAIDLRKSISDTEKNSEKWLKIKDEIRITDQKIDQEVYRLYGLTEKEIRIV